jgi:hypothetical protein
MKKTYKLFGAPVFSVEIDLDEEDDNDKDFGFQAPKGEQ